MNNVQKFINLSVFSILLLNSGLWAKEAEKKYDRPFIKLKAAKSFKINKKTYAVEDDVLTLKIVDATKKDQPATLVLRSSTTPNEIFERQATFSHEGVATFIVPLGSEEGAMPREIEGGTLKSTTQEHISKKAYTAPLLIAAILLDGHPGILAGADASLIGLEMDFLKLIAMFFNGDVLTELIGESDFFPEDSQEEVVQAFSHALSSVGLTVVGAIAEPVLIALGVPENFAYWIGAFAPAAAADQASKSLKVVAKPGLEYADVSEENLQWAVPASAALGLAVPALGYAMAAPRQIDEFAADKGRAVVRNTFYSAIIKVVYLGVDTLPGLLAKAISKERASMLNNGAVALGAGALAYKGVHAYAKNPGRRWAGHTMASNTIEAAGLAVALGTGGAVTALSGEDVLRDPDANDSLRQGNVLLGIAGALHHLAPTPPQYTGNIPVSDAILYNLRNAALITAGIEYANVSKYLTSLLSDAIFGAPEATYELTYKTPEEEKTVLDEMFADDADEDNAEL